MSIKSRFGRINQPIDQIHAEHLKTLADEHSECLSIECAKPRELVNLFGEVTALRIVPRAGSPSLEATIGDGSGMVVAVWTGRRRIGGVSPGRRLVISGRGSAGPGGRLVYFNPRYELL